MNDLNSLHDAFAALERRADAVSETTEFVLPVHAAPPRTRLLAPAVAVAAVVATAGAVAILSSGSDGRVQQAGGVSPSAAPTTAAPTTAAPTSAVPTGVTHGFRPPANSAELATRARSILSGIASITVVADPDPGAGAGSRPVQTGPTPSGSATPRIPVPPSTILVPPPATPAAPSDAVPAPPSASDGPAIRGTLTAAGRSGGYDLNVFATSSGTAGCDADTQCSVTTLTDGSSLAVGSFHDPLSPGGVTYQVEVVRPDGAEILLHLSTEKEPKGQSMVTTDTLPLTRRQMIDFVTSDRW